MGSREGLTLRQKALEALQKSTQMLQVALDLLTQGNQVEAARVQKEARKQRTISTFLMAEANKLEMNLNIVRSEHYPNSTHHKMATRETH